MRKTIISGCLFALLLIASSCELRYKEEEARLNNEVVSLPVGATIKTIDKNGWITFTLNGHNYLYRKAHTVNITETLTQIK